MDPYSLHLLAAGLGIVLIDLVLSGDNVLVIGAVAARLPGHQQRIAIVWGGVGALVLRFAMAAVATELLLVPLLQAIGGLIVLGIAVRLALPERVGRKWWEGRGRRLLSAILMVTIADITMSLDNVLAVGALAGGNIPLLAFGLVVSMALLFLASAVVAALIRRLWWLMDVAVVVLGWTAASMIVGDRFLNVQVQQLQLSSAMRAQLIDLVYLVCVGIALAADLGFHLVPLYRGRRGDKKPQQSAQESPKEIPHERLH